jgi:transposase-like protein
MNKRVRRGDPQREQQWQAAVRQWETSGQSIRNYCRAQGLKESAFYFWRRKLARRGRQGVTRQEGKGRQPAGNHAEGKRVSALLRPAPRAGQDQAGFLPVQVVLGRGQATASGVEIVVGNGRLVRVQPGFDRQLLAEVLHVLEARAC